MTRKKIIHTRPLACEKGTETEGNVYEENEFCNQFLDSNYIGYDELEHIYIKNEKLYN